MIDAVQSRTTSQSTAGWLSAGNRVSTEDFLHLLTTQLRYQNPLEPMKETEFVTQLAQFSQLEAARNTTNLASRLLELQMLGASAGLLGRRVVLRPAGSDEFVSGVVEKVKVVEGTPWLVVNGQEFNLSDVAEILR
ncbi:MAG: flagellar hook capping FlgD N-terminal domain-containing protein [Bacillota bacterium]